MDSLLPSEIARLVLGYLEEQKCEDAARSFLEYSPHLHECRAVTTTGRRFSTRVNGFTLIDILEKFCAANALVQERLSKVSDCEQLKHCGDLLEQLRFLVDGSRGQRFVVNINVPTTSQASGGSPIISSSLRKRHHSGSERDRLKRTQKSQNSGKVLQPLEPVSEQLGCGAVETTPLEHLPGHSGSDKVDNYSERNFEKCLEDRPMDICPSVVTEAAGVQVPAEAPREPPTSLGQVPELRTLEVAQGNLGSVEKEESSRKKCSTATDTEELMCFTNTEVQTTPYDIVESETELTDEPVENLSLLTKELLNRTELQERIAENINKAILPADISLRDASLCENLGGEINTSIMTELNNAIKSVVTATESDPVFAKFLDEIIGRNGENDTSPDEDGSEHQTSNPVFPSVSPEIPKPAILEASTPFEKKPMQKQETPEVPLKNRLRSSSNQQTTRPEESEAVLPKFSVKEDAVLEDLNAAAILSIINANATNEKRNELLEPAKEDTNLNSAISDKNLTSTNSAVPFTVINDVPLSFPPAATSNTTTETKPVTKTKTRKPPSKSKPKTSETIPESLISEEEIMAMPTLIVCSKEGMSCFIGVPPEVPKPPTMGGYNASQFLPIAPKTSDPPPPKPEPLYLRTVNVPINLPKLPVNPEDSSGTKKRKPVAPEPNKERRRPSFSTESNKVNQKIREKVEQENLSSVLELPSEDNNNRAKTAEKITLYGNESSNITVLHEAVLPTVNVDEPVSVSGTGLSPFLKFNNVRSSTVESTENTKVPEQAKPSTAAPEPGKIDTASASTSKQQSIEILTKRTPRSLLKSRSKNYRLSLSTPRRRSSHIRALDFNTPTKSINASRRMSINDSNVQFSPKSCNLAKNVCRTSLFKSPPFEGHSSPSSGKKLRNASPAKDRRPCKIPIATRSPAPKLMGGWEKYTGVGIILGSTSPSSVSSTPVKNNLTKSEVKKSWDADLRHSLKIVEDAPARKVPPKKQQMKRRGHKKKTGNCSTVEVEDGLLDGKSSNSRTEAGQAVSAASTPSKDEELIERLRSDSTETQSIAKFVETSENLESKEAKKNLNCPKDNLKEEGAVPNGKEGKEGKDNLDPDKKDCLAKKSVKKKYAQLKTITTSVTKIVDRRDCLMDTLRNIDTSERSLEFGQGFHDSNQRLAMQLPNMIDLETPRKLDINFGIPPTPRLLSPSSNLLAPFGLQMCQEDSVRVQSFVPTPEFPNTPCIAVTPKQLSENTVEAEKKDGLSCSNYYQPSSELKDPRIPKQLNEHSRQDMSLPLPGMLTVDTCETRLKNISVQVAQGFQSCMTSSSKLEITQFEVIKENLPKEETFRELKISSLPGNEQRRSIEEALGMQNTGKIEVPLGETSKSVDKSGSTIDDDSSDSDSSCSSDSSSSSSTSSSSSSSATNTSAIVTIPTKQFTKRTPNRIYTDTSNESVQKSAANLLLQQPVEEEKPSPRKVLGLECSDYSKSQVSMSPRRSENEASPKKVFPIVKTEEMLKESLTETPVKDETLIAEANISETPSSSKAGFENVTNLTSKISAFITTEEGKRKSAGVREKQSQVQRKCLPKVVSVQRILPNVSVALKPVINNESSSNVVHGRNNSLGQINASLSNAALSRQLEEKRLRMMAKFKEQEKSPAYRSRIKRSAVSARARKRAPGGVVEGSAREKRLSRQGSVRSREGELGCKKEEEDEELEENEMENKRGNLRTEIKKMEIIRQLCEESVSSNKLKEGEQQVVPGGSRLVDPEEKSSTVDRNADGALRKDIGERIEDLTSRSRGKEAELSNIVEDRGTERSRGKVCSAGENLEENLVEGELVEKRRSQSPERAPSPCEKNSKRGLECNQKAAVVIDTKKSSVTKSKVDLVRRDLFSDEESSDQRTTRSKSRQNCDGKEPEAFSLKINEKIDPGEQKKDLPGVLECLHLVPTVKSDILDEDSSAVEVSRRHAEYHFIYDETVPTKRRKRKFSNSELEFSVEVELSDDDYKTCSKIMTATAYEEIFNLSPPRKRRGPSKESLKTVKCKTRENITANENQNSIKMIFNYARDKPLATSSPVLKIASKVVKSPSKKVESQQTETKKATTMIKTDKQSDSEKQNPKSRKRKASVCRESEQVDKKVRVSSSTNLSTATTTTVPTATNPQLLLKKLDLDKFLTSVHGPA